MSQAVAVAPSSRGPLARLAQFALVALLLFALLYYPYPPESLPSRLLFAYIAGVARVAAFTLSIFEPSVMLADQTVIAGRFPLQIVLDCTALDVQALYVAAVIAAPTRNKLLGALAGVAFLAAANLARIIALYYVGVYARARFDLIHEDVLTFAMLASACLALFVFVTRVDRYADRSSHRTPLATAPAGH